MATLHLTGHYLKDALFLAYACAASYQDDPTSTASYKKIKLDTPAKLVKSGSDYAFVTTVGRHLIVAIRGSDDSDDWAKNVDFRKFTKLDGRVHRGFWNGMQSIYPSVESSIKALPYADKNLILTGHSRGGALAVLMAQFLYTKYADVDDEMIPDQIYTFGAPRVGDIDFYHNYDLRAQTRLFINEGDPVPTTPLTSTGFYHVNEQYLMLKNSVTDVDMDLALTQSSFYDAYVRIKAGGPDFGDHSLTKGYIPNLKRNLGW